MDTQFDNNINEDLMEILTFSNTQMKKSKSHFPNLEQQETEDILEFSDRDKNENNEPIATNPDEVKGIEEERKSSVL